MGLIARYGKWRRRRALQSSFEAASAELEGCAAALRRLAEAFPTTAEIAENLRVAFKNIRGLVNDADAD